MSERPLDHRHTPITFSRDHMTVIHAAMREGDTLPPCPNCEGTLSMGEPAAAGGTVGPVFQVMCADCGRAAFLTEVSGARRTINYRKVAKSLPDTYQLLDMLPTYRVQQLVQRNWPAHSEADRRLLVEELRPILEPLAEAGVEVTDEAREQCVDIVTRWIDSTDSY
jgi:hypothetical protein